MTALSKKIIAIGEAMVELSKAPQSDFYRIGIAGDTLNTAWYLRAKLDPSWQVNFYSRVGQGEFSDKMLDFLAEAGIGSAYVTRDAQREIGLYAISLQKGERSFTYWRETSAAKGLAEDAQALSSALSDHSLIYLSGITLAILPPKGRETLCVALQQARAAGAQIVFDTNLRPKLWEDLDQMRLWVTRLAALSDLMLPSFDDEALYFGDADSQATLARYLAAGARQIILKAGGGPIHYAGQIATGVLADLRPETAIDTTAAGDSFNGGFLAAYLQGQPLPQAIIAGHELSRRVIRYHGALVKEAL